MDNILMNDNTNDNEDFKKNYTLEKLLKSDGLGIVVPKIQRDFAMGRINKSEKEKRIDFLFDIMSHLKNGTEMTLDYVYGNKKESEFYPLDGQQRLTVLWLVHWYLLYKTDSIDDNKNKWIKNFSYETRQSSSEFCKKLCEIKQQEVGKMPLSKYIKSQSWFYVEWIQDPTIDSMLRTLSGEEEKQGKDSIEGVFKGHTKTLEKYKNNLDKIQFNILIIPEKLIPNTDELYIKMNARGKRLSDFENFKADLIDSLGDDLVIPSLIDNDWTDIFWSHRTADYKIDDIFFLFINNFVFNKLVENKGFIDKIDDDKNKIDENREITYGDLYTLLYSKDMKRGNIISYTSFTYYKTFLRKDVELIELKRLMKLLKEIGGNFSIKSVNEQSDDLIDDNDEPEESNVEINIIPKFNQKGMLVTSQKERVYLYALSCFANVFYEKEEANAKTMAVNGEADSEENTKNLDLKTSCARWLRVVGNIIENASISTQDTMISTMKLIYNLSKEFRGNENNDLYKMFAECVSSGGLNDTKINVIEDGDNERSRQLKEEIWKAYLIVDKGWDENRIIEAEKHSFFNGSIRFLLRDEKGKFYDNKDMFERKYKKTQEYFPQNSGNKIENDDVIDKFRRQFKDIKELAVNDIDIFSTVGYKTRGFCWKDFLCDDRFVGNVHNILLTGDTVLQSEEYKVLLANKPLIDAYVEKDKSYRSKPKNYVIINDNGGWAFHIPKSSDYLYFYSGRKEKCQNLYDMVNNHSVELLKPTEYIGGYYVGKEICFCEIGVTDHYYKWVVEKNNNNAVDKLYLVTIDSNDEEHIKSSCLWEKDTSINDLKNLA